MWRFSLKQCRFLYNIDYKIRAEKNKNKKVYDGKKYIFSIQNIINV